MSRVQRILKLCLTLAFVIGVVMFGLAKREQQPIKAEYDRLTAKFGEMSRVSPDLCQVLRLPTDKPWDFNWRFRQPENSTIVFENFIAFGGGSCSGSSLALRMNGLENQDQILRIVTHLDGPQLRCFLSMSSQAMTCGSGSKATAESFRQHWNELQIETSSVGEVVEFDPDKVYELIRITAPERFSDDSLVKCGPDGLCLLVRVGTSEAFEKERTAAERQP